MSHVPLADPPNDRVSSNKTKKMLKNMKGMQLQIEKLSKEGETRHAVEKRFEKNSYPRRSIQFQSRAGWKNYLTNEQKRDRLNKPCYSATGKRVYWRI